MQKRSLNTCNFAIIYYISCILLNICIFTSKLIQTYTNLLCLHTVSLLLYNNKLWMTDCYVVINNYHRVITSLHLHLVISYVYLFSPTFVLIIQLQNSVLLFYNNSIIPLATEVSYYTKVSCKINWIITYKYQSSCFKNDSIHKLLMLKNLKAL